MAGVAVLQLGAERFEMDKKQLKAVRDNFALHVLLAMRDGHSKAVASAVAYGEGQEALARRLGERAPSAVVVPATAKLAAPSS